MQIGGFQKSSLLDYPEKIVAIIFTKGCNFRCGYCHNPELVLNQNEIILENEIIDFLKTRVNKLDGVVVTGGEPCLQKDLSSFIKNVRELGFLIKLDTNGSYLDVLKNLLEQGLLDYVAMDIKAPWEKYKVITNSNIDIEKVAKSIDLIMNCGLDYEFRTTVVKSLLDFDDFTKIGEMIMGAKKYYLQKFVSSKVLDDSFISAQTYTDKEFEQIKNILEKYIDIVHVR